MKLNSNLRLFLIRSVSLGLLTSAASAAEIQKAAVENTNNLNTGAAWVGGTAPGANVLVPDVALWDITVTASNLTTSDTLTPLGGDVSWQGIKVTDVGGTRHVTGSSNSHIRILNASSANTLTLGSAGIVMSSALQALLIQSKITLAADQEWNVANAAAIGNPFGFNSNEDLGLQALAVNTAFNLNEKTLTLTGAGQITISSGHAISNGTINVQNKTRIQGGSSRVASLSDTVAVNITAGGNLRLQANGSGASVTSAADISVSGVGSTLDFGLSDGSGSSNTSSSGDISMATGTILQITGGAGAFTQSGGIAFTGDVNWNYSGSTAHANGAVVSGNLTGNGSVNYSNINSNANGQVRLSGDNSGFTGTMTLNGASNNRALRLTSATAGSAAATWAVNALNTLQVDGVSVQLGTLNGAGTVTNSHASNAATLNVGAGTFSGVISDGATATTSLVKNTSATLTLSGPNSYTGATAINEGTLTLGVTDCLANTSNVVIGAGTLQAAAGVNDTVGTLDPTAAATINLGDSNSKLVFAASNGVDWTGGTLNITGAFVSGSSLKFGDGTPGTGLNGAQLAAITINGVPGSYTLDGSGFLVSGGGPVGFAAWQAANGTLGGRDQDHDNDGVDNGTEHFIYGTVPNSGFTALPGVTNTGGTLSVTWTKAGTYTGSYPTDFVVETSATLAAPWAPIATIGTPNVANTVHISGNNVTYTFPAGTKNFARLKVTGP